MIWHDFPIAIHRTARKKTLCIVIERDGSIAVQAPIDLPEENILSILDSKEYEIFHNRALWEESNRESLTRQYISGQSFLYLGVNCLLKVMHGQKQHLIFKDNTFFLSDAAKNPREDFIRFYKTQAKNKIDSRMEVFRQYFDITPKKVQIREMATRWASCTTDGTIYYNWRCVMMPLFVLDYLIVHEWTHLTHPNHSREFWLRISEILPDYSYAEEWLKINGVKATL